MKYDLQYSCYGERSILIEWPQIIDENILNDILNFKKSIELIVYKVKLEVIPSYNSILINYGITIDNINDNILTLKRLYSKLEYSDVKKSTTWEVPVCYDKHFGFDLENFAKEKSLSISEVIHLHSQPVYTIFFIGFLPGFLYLGGLDASLHFNRKSSPNLNIKKGAVGIGGNQTGIYPQNSPGGWHIIGQSPIDFFDINSTNPCFANPGDKIKFKSISLSNFNEILREVKNNTYQFKTLKYD